MFSSPCPPLRSGRPRGRPLEPAAIVPHLCVQPVAVHTQDDRGAPALRVPGDVVDCLLQDQVQVPPRLRPQLDSFRALGGAELESDAADVVRKGYGRVLFGHSELTGFQLWDAACDEGERAVKQVMEIA